MSSPSIQYTLPTSRSFAGMKRVLFQPFDAGKWFVLGFTAWLAGLLDGGGSGGGSNSYSGEESEGVNEFFKSAGEWAKENIELVIGVGSALLLLCLAIFIALLWVSSRGKFMFLDNLVHNRAQVKTPWKRFRAQGDSLFLWKLVFGLIVLFTLLLVGGAFTLFALALGEVAWPAIVLGVLVLLPLVLVLIYITILLEDFVIPMMYRDSLSTNEAWKRFLALHRTSAGSFLLYALWKTLLTIAAIVGIVTAGLLTCCIAFLFMMIPYIGAVLLLPVSVFFRFLGPEFLKQFGADFDILPPEADEAIAQA